MLIYINYILSLNKIKPKNKQMPKVTDFQTDAQKMGANQLSKAINQLEAFTNNLQGKVNGILKAQETQFVNSYKLHMQKVKKQFDDLALELQRKDQIIQDYENQGKMANLIKRVNYLQDEEKKLLSDLEKKKKDIKQLVLQNQIQKSEIRRLQQKVKQLIRSKATMTQKIQRDHNASYQSIPTFTTQIGHDHSKDRLSKMMTQQRSVKMRSLNRRSEKSEISVNPQFSDSNRLQRQISLLKKQNRQLLSFNSKFISETSETQNFFLETINEIKKNIAIRKQMKQCTLEEFRKQDKLQLLIKVLSNDEIVFKLYNIIFGKQENPFVKEKLQIDRPISIKNRLSLKKSGQYHFPSINSARLS